MAKLTSFIKKNMKEQRYTVASPKGVSPAEKKLHAARVKVIEKQHNVKLT